ncbi:hypothetical protein CCAN2_1240005 [Capnocytophaga canimorsus]|nr:hypothetical protein CCAN2_1240005 [Capnocytophaga canimorsus]
MKNFSYLCSISTLKQHKMLQKIFSNLLFKVIIAILLGILFGQFFPEWFNRIFATFNGLLVSFFLFHTINHYGVDYARHCRFG